MSDRIDRLTKSRDKLTALLETATESTAPALSRELRAVLAELGEIAPAASPKGTVLDEVNARREAKQAEA